MRGSRLLKANRIAKRRWDKYHKHSLRLWPLAEYPEIGVYRKTNVFCSNPFCCGNPRRVRGRKNLSRKELLALLDKEEFYDDLE